MTRIPFFAALAVAGAAFTPAAFAEETICTGTIGAVALDNVFVPDGARCTLDRTRLNGNVVVGTGARLTARSVSVNGNVQAEGARQVTVSGRSMIGGSVQIVQGVGATVRGATIGGDVLVDEQTGAVIAERNRVTGSMQFFANTGGVSIVDNRINGNLQCKENNPAPTGGGNQAASKEDQCAAL
jgi:hypothetical protein